VRSALEELEQLLARTRAVEASLAAVPLPACSAAGAGGTWWDAPLARSADAHAHVVVTCAPAARSDRGWAAPEKQRVRAEAAAAEPAVHPARCWEAPCPRRADVRHCSAPSAGSCQDPAHAARSAAPGTGPTAGQWPQRGDPPAPSVRIRCGYDDRAAPAAPRAEASGRGARGRAPRAHGCAAAGRPPARPPLGRRRCGVPRSALEAALWRLADAEDAWAAERAGARREAEELRKRAARLERELRQLQARALPARQYLHWRVMSTARGK